MGGESGDNGFHNIVMGASAASNMNMRFGIEWPALVSEPAESCCGIGCSEERPRIPAASAIGQYFDRGIEPDCDRPLVEDLPRSRIDECAATGGDDSNFSVDETSNQSPLSIPKVGLAETLEDFGGRIARRVLDRRIAVDEGQAEPPRETPADG